MEDFALSLEEKRVLIGLARSSMERYVRNGELLDEQTELARAFPVLAANRACFVTLTVRGALRGCIGSLEPRRPLLDDVRLNAISAAVQDSRFSPVGERELAEIEVEISVLDVPKLLVGVAPDQLIAYLEKTKPGLILEYLGRRSTFLPSVWEALPSPQDFLSRLCRKQGSPPTCWRDPRASMSTYGSIHFTESEVR